MTLMQHSKSLMIAVGAGLAGVAAMIYHYRKTSIELSHAISFNVQEIERINSLLLKLQSDLDELRGEVGTLMKIKDAGSSAGYLSIHVSSDEDDDIWQDPLQGPLTEAGTSHDSQEHSKEHPFVEVDKLLEGGDDDKESALLQLQLLHETRDNDAELLWRLAKATYFYSSVMGARNNSGKQRELIYKAKDIAFKSIEANPESSDGHKWCAITIGSVGEYESSKQKLMNGIKYKEHIDLALQIKPSDPSLHYLSGRFAHGIASLSWLERKAAAALFGTLPDVTIDDALDSFLEAERLKPGEWKENMLFIAKCYLQKRNLSEAVSWLQKAESLPVKSADDSRSHTEVKKLLSQHK